ncbi:energy-coupling factor ABC transporter ATP-binding protein [Persephonella sp.]
MISLENVYFSYENSPVLRDISFQINEKEKVVLLGINGCGKSTLLKILNGLIFPEKGSYYFKGELITEKKLKNKEFTRKFRKSNVLLFQNPDSMIFNPTVYDEIAFGLRQLFPDSIDEKVHFWAEKLGISHLLKRSPFELSGGEKQKVCLASILVLEPELLLLDEPTANLDPRSTGWFVDFLSELDITVITTTHNLSLAPELGSRVIVLSEDHNIIYDGDINSFIEDIDLLKKANLVHTHYHRHGTLKHKHYHTHDF